MKLIKKLFKFKDKIEFILFILGIFGGILLGYCFRNQLIDLLYYSNLV